jgi:hypothetical protein
MTTTSSHQIATSSHQYNQEAIALDAVPVYAAIALKILAKQQNKDPEEIAAITSETFQKLSAATHNHLEQIPIYRRRFMLLQTKTQSHHLEARQALDRLMELWPESDTTMYVGVDAGVLARFMPAMLAESQRLIAD